MKIVKAQVFQIGLPMKFPFTTGFGTISARESVIIRLETDQGVIGWGESAALSAPIYNPETTQTTIHIIKDFLIPKLLSRDLEIEEYVTEINSIRGNRIAKFGVECALWGIRSQLENKTVSNLLGAVRTEIPVGESIGIQKSIEDTISVIAQKLAEGYQRIKLKIKPGWDLELIKSVRQRFPDIVLMVDANSSYSLKDIELFEQLDQYNLLMIEQPLADDDIIDHAQIQKRIKTPICLDESINSVEDARKAIELGSCKIINVKPGRVGGIIESQKINALAKANHIPLWCGGMLETGIAKGYNLHVASMSEFTLPADSSPALDYFFDDIISPSMVVKDNGTITVPTDLGLGYQIKEDVLRKVTVSDFILK